MRGCRSHPLQSPPRWQLRERGAGWVPSSALGSSPVSRWPCSSPEAAVGSEEPRPVPAPCRGGGRCRHPRPGAPVSPFPRSGRAEVPALPQQLVPWSPPHPSRGAFPKSRHQPSSAVAGRQFDESQTFTSQLPSVDARALVTSAGCGHRREGEHGGHAAWVTKYAYYLQCA